MLVTILIPKGLNKGTKGDQFFSKYQESVSKLGWPDFFGGRAAN